MDPRAVLDMPWFWITQAQTNETVDATVQRELSKRHSKSPSND